MKVFNVFCVTGIFAFASAAARSETAGLVGTNSLLPRSALAAEESAALFPLEGGRVAKGSPAVTSTIDDHKVIPLPLLRHNNIWSTASSNHRRLQGGNWSQLGQDIDGEAASDESGTSVSLSADGRTVAIGAIGNDGNGGNSGHVRIFIYNGTEYVQRGNDIDGEAASDSSGMSVSLSADGDTVAIGAIGNDANGGSSGHVRIFAWSGTDYVQRGNDIDGEATGDKSGRSVSLSEDGRTVAIGAIGNDGNGGDSGHVRIFIYNGNDYVQRGNDIDGEAASDESGSVSLSADGRTVAIGAWLNDGNGGNSGHVRIFAWNETDYVQRGNDIDGEAAGDSSGWSVSLSADGRTVAIGAHHNSGNGGNSGHVRIFAWNDTDYVQRGNDIDGEADMDRSGVSVSLSADGDTVAIGARYNDGNSGHVRIFAWNGTDYVQRGIDIDGEAECDYSGALVSLSADGDTVAIGAIGNDGNGGNSGHVRVYTFTGPTQSQSITNSTSALWLIEFKSMEVAFTSNSTNEEVRLTYEVGTGRVPVTKLYSGGCEPDQATKDELNVIGAGPITKMLQLTGSDTPSMDTYELSYDFNKSLIATSDFWNNITKSIELCQVVQLVHERTEADDLVIQEDMRDITIGFELFANFSIDVGLDKATINTANGTSDLEGYISAYHCDGNDDMNKMAVDAKLKPNDVLAVCLFSSSTDVEIDEITSMVIKGDDLDGIQAKLVVMSAGTASIPAITETRFRNSTAFIVQTRVPINQFNFALPGASIDVGGSMKLNLKGEANSLSRELALAAVPKNERRLQSKSADSDASFEVSIGLEADKLQEGGPVVLVASATATVHSSLVTLCVFYAVYIMWY